MDYYYETQSKKKKQLKDTAKKFKVDLDYDLMNLLLNTYFYDIC